MKWDIQSGWATGQCPTITFVSPHHGCTDSQPSSISSPTAQLCHTQNQLKAAKKKHNFSEMCKLKVLGNIFDPKGSRFRTFPSSIGLSLIWTTGPGWVFEELLKRGKYFEAVCKNHSWWPKYLYKSPLTLVHCSNSLPFRYVRDENIH